MVGPVILQGSPSTIYGYFKMNAMMHDGPGFGSLVSAFQPFDSAHERISADRCGRVTTIWTLSMTMVIERGNMVAATSHRDHSQPDDLEPFAQSRQAWLTWSRRRRGLGRGQGDLLRLLATPGSDDLRMLSAVIAKMK